MSKKNRFEKDLKEWKEYFKKFRKKRKSFKAITNGKKFKLKEITDEEHAILIKKGVIKEITSQIKPIKGDYKALVHALAGAYTISNFYEELEKIKEDLATQSRTGATTKKHFPELSELEQKIQKTCKKIRKSFQMEQTFEEGARITLNKLGIRCSAQLDGFQLTEEELQNYIKEKRFFYKETAKDPAHMKIIRELYEIQETSRKAEITTEEFLKKMLETEKKLYTEISHLSKSEIDLQIKNIENILSENNLKPTHAGLKYILGKKYQPEKTKTSENLIEIMLDSRGILNRIEHKINKNKQDKKAIHSQVTIEEGEEETAEDPSKIIMIIAMQGANYAAEHMINILRIGDKYRKEIEKREQMFYQKIKNPNEKEMDALTRLKKILINKAEDEAKTLRKKFETELTEYLQAYEKNIEHPFYIGLFEVLKSYGVRSLIEKIGKRIKGDSYRTDTLNLGLMETLSL